MAKELQALKKKQEKQKNLHNPQKNAKNTKFMGKTKKKQKIKNKCKKKCIFILAPPPCCEEMLFQKCTSTRVWIRKITTLYGIVREFKETFPNTG